MIVTQKSFSVGVPKKKSKKDLYGSAFYQMGRQRGQIDAERKKAAEDSQQLMIQQAKVDTTTAGLQQAQIMIQNMLQMIQSQVMQQDMQTPPPLQGVGYPANIPPPLQGVGQPANVPPPLPMDMQGGAPPIM